MEATSHASVQGRLDGVRFAVLVFTNLAHEHLDFHGSMEEYFAGEAPPVRAGRPRGRQRRRPVGQAARGRASTMRSRSTSASTASTPTSSCAAASTSRTRSARRPRRVRSGSTRTRSARASKRWRACRGASSSSTRDSRSPSSSTTRTSPRRSRRVLQDAARARATGRVICVFGCGGDRDREKRPLMGRIASELADVAIVTSDNPRSEDPRAIIDEVLAGAPELEVEPDRRAAIARAIESRARRRRRADRGQGPRAGPGDRGRRRIPSTTGRSRASVLRALQPA